MNHASFRSTGIAPINRLLGGGVAAGAVHLILGCSGSGRTTLAAMFAAEGAKRAYRAALGGRTLQPWVFASSSEEPVDARRRATSHLAGASYDDVFAALGRFSAEKRELLANEFFARGRKAGKLPRYAAAQLIVRRALISVEVRQTTPGWGPLVEFFSSSDFRGPIGGCVLDDVEGPANDYIRLTGRDEPHILIREVLRNLRSCVATPHHAPVWAVHRLANKLMEAPAQEVIRHSQTADCKTVWEEAETCLILGNGDGRGRFKIACTLRRGQRSRSSFVARFKGHGATIVEDVHKGIETSLTRSPAGIPRVSFLPQGLAKIRSERAELERLRRGARQIWLGPNED